LISEPAGDCWGIAYNCKKSGSQRVIEKLDLREKGGYHRESVKLNFIDGSTTEGLVYVAGPDNSDYLGPADEVDIVTQILLAQGPSGSNREYLKNLASSLRSLGVSDPHVFSIESKVQVKISTE
jgi:cation transport regulator ChaC